MKISGVAAAIAVGVALSPGVSTATAHADRATHTGAHTERTQGLTTDRNPFSGYEGYCTWGAQELIHDHTGYYIKALTGNAESWADQAAAGGWTVATDPQPHSIAVFSTALVGGVGHVAWVDAVHGNNMTITEMNTGFGGTAANAYRTTGFNQFDTRTTKAIPGISYILIP
jgi:surface antigen